LPILRIKEIRDLSSDERQKRLGELQTELVRLRTMIKAGGSIENPSRVRELRKAVARILTVENQPAPAPAPVKKVEKKKKEDKKKKEKKKTKEDKEE